MAENKKDKSAGFARDKSAFSKGGSEKGTASKKVQHKHSGTHQPRDANDTSGDVLKQEQSEAFGQNVQKSGLSTKRRNKKQYQKQDTFGHSENPSAEQKNLKSENTDADSKRKSDFSQENNTFTRDFAFKKKSPILPIIYETKRGIKIRNKNYSFFMYKQSKRTPFRV